MKSIVRQCLVLLAFLVFTGSYAYADGGASLRICNKGSDQIHVVVAIRDSTWPLGNSWDVNGWKSIDPGGCERVYSTAFGEPAYIGFSFADSRGHLTSAGHIEQAPNFGWNGFTKVLTRSDKRLCVRSHGMAYKVRNDLAALDCASFHSGGDDPEGYVPLASALYFVPKVMECSDLNIIGQDSCSGGDYYLNVRPTASDRELHASAGAKDDQDQPPAKPGIGDAIVKALGKAVEENRKAQAALQPFVDACNAFFRDPAMSGHRDPTAWCKCLGDHYRGVMTSEEEARYANEFKRLFWNGIAEPRSTDPAWPRLHPAVNACAQ